MVLNAFYIQGIRGEISDGNKYLLSSFTNKEELPKGIWVTDNDTFINTKDIINYSAIIYKPLTNLNSIKDNITKYSSIEQFISESYKQFGINSIINFYSEDLSLYTKIKDYVENINVILINKMYENSIDYLSIDDDLVEDSNWIKSKEYSYKKLRYIKRIY